MPIYKVKGGWKIKNVKHLHKTKASAVRQLKAIKASQARAAKKKHK